MKSQTIEALKEMAKAFRNVAILANEDGCSTEELAVLNQVKQSANDVLAALELEQPANSIELPTDKIYLCTDGENAEVKLLLPRGCKIEVVHLTLDDPNPETNDMAEYKLLAEAMDETTYDC